MTMNVLFYSLLWGPPHFLEKVIDCNSGEMTSGIKGIFKELISFQQEDKILARQSRLQIIYAAGLFSLSLWYDGTSPAELSPAHSSPVLRTWPKLKMQLYFAAVSCSCCSVRQQHCSSCRLALARCSAAAVSLSSYLLPSTPAIFESPLTNNEIVWNMILLYALYFRLQE